MSTKKETQIEGLAQKCLEDAEEENPDYGSMQLDVWKGGIVGAFYNVFNA